MYNLIKSEFYKIFKTKPFWITNFILFFILILVFIGSKVLLLMDSEITTFSGVYFVLDRLQGSSSINMLCLAIFIVYFFTLDNQNSCIKNIFGRNISRFKYYMCKFICCIITSIFIYGFNMLLYLIIGSILYGFDTTNIFNLQGFIYLCIIQTILLITYITIMQVICVKLSSFGASITTIVLILIFEGLIPFSLTGLVRLFATYNINLVSMLITSLILLTLIISFNLLGIKILKKKDF